VPQVDGNTAPHVPQVDGNTAPHDVPLVDNKLDVSVSAAGEDAACTTTTTLTTTTGTAAAAAVAAAASDDGPEAAVCAPEAAVCAAGLHDAAALTAVDSSSFTISMPADVSLAEDVATTAAAAAVDVEADGLAVCHNCRQHKQLNDSLVQQLDALNQERKTERDEHCALLESKNEELEALRLKLESCVKEVDQLKVALDRYKQQEVERKHKETRPRSWQSADVTAADEATEAAAANECCVTDHEEVSAVAGDDNDETSATGNTAAGNTAAGNTSTDDEPVNKCPICNLEFTDMVNAESLSTALSRHIEEHVVKICRVCTMEFTSDTPDNVFESHCRECYTEYERHVRLQNQQP